MSTAMVRVMDKKVLLLASAGGDGAGVRSWEEKTEESEVVVDASA